MALLSGCSTGPVNIALSMNRLDSPEANGKLFAGRVHGGHRSEHKITLTPDYGIFLINSSKPDINSVSQWGMGGGLGLLDRLDGDVKLEADTPAIVQLKYQLFGATRREAPKSGFSAAVTAGYGHESQGASGETFLGTQRGTYSLKGSLYDFSLILGYRFNEETLLYGGPAATFVEYQGDQALFGQASTHFGGHITHQLAHVGVIYTPRQLIEPPKRTDGKTQYGGEGLFFQPEISLADLEVQKTKKMHLNGAINVGAMW